MTSNKINTLKDNDLKLFMYPQSNNKKKKNEKKSHFSNIPEFFEINTVDCEFN